MITFVTAFLAGASPKHSRDDYLAWFQQLANTGVPIVLFLDPSVEWTTFPPNVRVVSATLRDTWIGHNVPTDVVLPTYRSPKDTREYMMIINAKTEFVLRASQLNAHNTDWFAWIDFGIGHVFRDPETTFARIRSLAPPPTPCIRTAGIWQHIPTALFDAVCWRYAGGFFLIHSSLVSTLHDAAVASIQRNLPRFAWEVNIWADIEQHGLNLGWFQADHNDSIIPFT
jgi:hypothetical protein